MEYISLNELRQALYSYLKERTDYSESKLNVLSNIIETEDIIHKVDSYMSEYVDEVLIDNETYLHYHCWFIDDTIKDGFPHETYYLKSDVIDGTVESYIKAHKLYNI